jgi:hypothetical protein
MSVESKPPHRFADLPCAADTIQATQNPWAAYFTIGEDGAGTLENLGRQYRELSGVGLTAAATGLPHVVGELLEELGDAKLDDSIALRLIHAIDGD